MSILWVLFPFAFFFAWLLVSSAGKRACPDCGATLDILQSPFTKSRRQWEQGGYLCRNCGCESDRSGVKVPRGPAPSWRWIGIAFMLPAVALLFAVFCVTLISPR